MRKTYTLRGSNPVPIPVLTNRSTKKNQEFHEPTKILVIWILKAVQNPSKVTIQGQEVVECDLCLNPVSFFCRRCWVNLWDSCVPVHLRVSSQRGHDVVDFAKKDDDDTCFWESHPKHECSAFCNTCDFPTCLLCVPIKHKSHNLCELSEKKWSGFKKTLFRKIMDVNYSGMNWKHSLTKQPDDYLLYPPFIKSVERSCSPRTRLAQIDR